jgi:hypothetical protein
VSVSVLELVDSSVTKVVASVTDLIKKGEVL